MDVVRVHGAKAVVVVGLLVVVVLAVVAVTETVVGRVVVRVVVVVVSMYTITEEDVSNERERRKNKVNPQILKKITELEKKMENKCLSFYSHISFMSQREIYFGAGEGKTERRQGGSVLSSFPCVTLRENRSKRINWNWQV